MLERHLGMNQNEVHAVSFRGTDEGKKTKSANGWKDNGNCLNSIGYNAIWGTIAVAMGRSTTLATEATGGRVRSTGIRTRGTGPY